MKKKIGLSIILTLEFVFFLICAIYGALNTPEMFKPIYEIGTIFRESVVGTLIKLLMLDQIIFNELIVVTIINVTFVIIYYIIFGLIGHAQKKSKEKKIMRVVKTHYVLNEVEKAKFDYKNYLKRFPVKRVLSLLIPLLIVAVFVLARFNIDLYQDYSVYNSYFPSINIYHEYIVPVLNVLVKDSTIITDFISNIVIQYIKIASTYFASIQWVEYVILGVCTVIICLVWYMIFSFLNLFVRKGVAKRKAKKARNKYIYKKDKEEYKRRIKYGKQPSSKSDAFIDSYEEEQNTPELSIGKVKKQKNKKKDDKNINSYYDDLGNGVKDLGIGEEKVNTEPKIEREVVYITEEDFDIVLEEEPVIEVVEEDGIDQIHKQVKEDELYFEKYQPDDVEIKSFEEYDAKENKVNDYVSSIDEDTKEEEVVNDDLVESKEEISKDEEEKVEEEIKDEKESLNENINSTPQEVEKEEVIDDGLTPLERYRLKKKMEKEKLLKEQEQANLEVEEPYDPLKKYRKAGIRAGKGEQRIPSFKEMEAQKQLEKQKRHEQYLARKAKKLASQQGKK